MDSMVASCGLMIDPRRVLTFRAVAHARSFSRAAAQRAICSTASDGLTTSIGTPKTGRVCRADCAEALSATLIMAQGLFFGLRSIRLLAWR